MDARLHEALVQRLVHNPQDQGAIAEAHAAGQQDPEGYARLLEQVGMSATTPSVACHWLNEAANVWETTFQDTVRTASVLVAATERDPTSEPTATRVAELLRANNDLTGLAMAMEKRAAAMAVMARHEPDWLPKSAALYEELGRFLAEPPVSDAARAKEAYARAVDLDPTSQFAIYSLRELHKAAGELSEALPYFGMEVALVTDPQRKLALYLDEAEVAKQAQRTDRAISALRHANRIDPSDPALRQQLATLILEKYRAGQKLEEAERNEGCDLFVALAEAYPGEHGFLYSLCALELNSKHDRAMQLALFFGEQLGRVREVAPLAAAYVRDNPQGAMIQQAQEAAGDAVAPAAPQPARASSDAAESQYTAAVGGAKRPMAAQRPTAARPPSGVTLDDLLERAAELARRSRKNEAIAVYRQALDLDPVNPDALNYLLEQLPIKRKYNDLKEILLSAIDYDQALDDDRLGWLRDLAGVCESQLRDVETAIYSWQRILDIEPGDEEASDQVKRLLEKGRRWDELAEVLRREAERAEDEEMRISLEKNLAKMHSTRRKDPVAAGEAWARIAGLSPGDDSPLQEAVKFFEKGERPDLAADAIAANVAPLDDDLVKRELYLKLGGIRAAQGQPLLAAEALAEGADDLGDASMWAKAEEYFVEAQAWEPAAGAADEQAAVAEKIEDKAALMARAAEYLRREGDAGEAVTRLEEVVALAPTNEEYSRALEELLVAEDRVDELVQMFLSRASAISDPLARVTIRKRTAAIQRDRLGDTDAARMTYALVLQDAEDEDSLQWLATEAEERGDAATAVDYLGRLTDATEGAARKVDIVLHQANLCATQLHEIDQAADRYEFVLHNLDDKNQAALQRLADLELGRSNYERAAELLERYLEATDELPLKLETAARLAEIYEVNLLRPEDAIRLLSFIHEKNPEDVEATQRLCELAEGAERWSLVAQLMGELISVQTGLEKISEMTRRLAEILHVQLDTGEEAMKILGLVGDRGDEPCRQAYIDLGDELEEGATVARRIVSWYERGPSSPERDEALHAAFERFVAAEEKAEAVAVAKMLIASGGAEPDIAETFENLSVQLQDLDGLSMAHELRATGMEGLGLASERVRQSEVLSRVGVPEEQAVAHAEEALSGVGLEDVEPLLARLADLCASASAKVDVYERQIARLSQLDERLVALVRAADVAVELEDEARARLLFDAPLSGGLEDDLLDLMVDKVRQADERVGSTRLRTNLVHALAEGGQGARDGGRTRSTMLGLAATIALGELDDADAAFQWVGDALILRVDDEVLELVEELAGNVGDYRRAEDVLGRALDQVFDGPLVRRLLARRAHVRQYRLEDLEGAADDLNRLHELSPSDKEVTDQLIGIYEVLGNPRGIVALLEDQILRNRDKELRAELARRVAHTWEDQLNDPREAADAWRRVLRLAPGDDEAKEGLARAKEEMLRAKAAKAEEPEKEPPATSSGESLVDDADDAPESSGEAEAAEEAEASAVPEPDAPSEPDVSADEDEQLANGDAPGDSDDDEWQAAGDPRDVATPAMDGVAEASAAIRVDERTDPDPDPPALEPAEGVSKLDEAYPAWGSGGDEAEEPTAVLDPSRVHNPATRVAKPGQPQAVPGADEPTTPGEELTDADSSVNAPLDEGLGSHDFEAATQVLDTNTMTDAAEPDDGILELDEVEEIEELIEEGDDEHHVGAPPPKPPPRRAPSPTLPDQPMPPLSAQSADQDDS